MKAVVFGQAVFSADTSGSVRKKTAIAAPARTATAVRTRAMEKLRR
ncbi:MAG TPA: hypothetical protein VLU06_08720 [Thermoanaerobaculia bacterium]|nr:hypothetical protein [Thermoanaerobaculia bacterium]